MKAKNKSKPAPGAAPKIDIASPRPTAGRSPRGIAGSNPGRFARRREPHTLYSNP
jgi:hypothetical protein